MQTCFFELIFTFLQCTRLGCSGILLMIQSYLAIVYKPYPLFQTTLTANFLMGSSFEKALQTFPNAPSPIKSYYSQPIKMGVPLSYLTFFMTRTIDLFKIMNQSSKQDNLEISRVGLRQALRHRVTNGWLKDIPHISFDLPKIVSVNEEVNKTQQSNPKKHLQRSMKSLRNLNLVKKQSVSKYQRQKKRKPNNIQLTLDSKHIIQWLSKYQLLKRVLMNERKAQSVIMQYVFANFTLLPDLLINSTRDPRIITELWEIMKTYRSYKFKQLRQKFNKRMLNDQLDQLNIKVDDILYQKKLYTLNDILVSLDQEINVIKMGAFRRRQYAQFLQVKDYEKSRVTMTLQSEQKEWGRFELISQQERKMQSSLNKFQKIY